MWRSFPLRRFFIYFFHNDKILIIKHIFIVFLNIFEPGTVLLMDHKWLRNYHDYGTWTTWHDFTPTGQRDVGKWYEKYSLHFIFTFFINRDISVIEFPPSLYFNKKDDSPWGPCLESKPSPNCWIAVERAQITFISTNNIANQNSYHDDKSTF